MYADRLSQESDGSLIKMKSMRHEVRDLARCIMLQNRFSGQVLVGFRCTVQGKSTQTKL